MSAISQKRTFGRNLPLLPSLPHRLGRTPLIRGTESIEPERADNDVFFIATRGGVRIAINRPAALAAHSDLLKILAQKIAVDPISAKPFEFVGVARTPFFEISHNRPVFLERVRQFHGRFPKFTNVIDLPYAPEFLEKAGDFRAGQAVFVRKVVKPTGLSWYAGQEQAVGKACSGVVRVNWLEPGRGVP